MNCFFINITTVTQSLHVEVDKETAFHLLHPTILKTHILHKTYGSKSLHRHFQLTLVRNIVEHAGPQPHQLQPCRPIISSGKKRGSPWANQSAALAYYNWKEAGLCSVSFLNKKMCWIQTKCKKCNAGLCTFACFKHCHIKANNRLEEGMDVRRQHLTIRYVMTVVASNFPLKHIMYFLHQFSYGSFLCHICKH
jgi:hypothetical protein